MSTLSENKFFFFYENCSCVKLHPGSLEHGYLALLSCDIDTAALLFSKLDSPRAKWAQILTCILKGYIKEMPTYFQIRNFLEIDLDLLLKNEKLDYVEQLLGALDFFVVINHEVYKYVARVMYENKLYSASLKYMEKSKKVYYNDAELHFLLARYYLRINNYAEARRYIDECLNLLPDYFPALELKQKIDELRI